MELNQVMSNPIIAKFLVPKEGNLLDIYFYIFVPVLSAQNLSGLKYKIYENYRVQGDVFNLVQSRLVYYCLP